MQLALPHVDRALGRRALGDRAQPERSGVSNILKPSPFSSPHDLGAAGYTQTSNILTPISLHWNGTVWSIVPVPGQGLLNAVTAVSATTFGQSESVSLRTQLDHVWNGTA